MWMVGIAIDVSPISTIYMAFMNFVYFQILRHGINEHRLFIIFFISNNYRIFHINNTKNPQRTEEHWQIVVER